MKPLLELLQQRITRGLGSGELGLVLASAGVGKTSFLINVALDELQAGRDVIHIALGQTLDNVQMRYETLLPGIGETDRTTLFRHRAIQTFADKNLTAGRVEKTLQTFRQHLQIKPTSILIDGFDVQSRTPEWLSAYKQLAASFGAQLWFSQKTGGSTPGQIVPGPIDLAVYLEPQDDCVQARLLKAFDESLPEEPVLWLTPSTLRPLPDKTKPAALGLAPGECMLFSGAHAGAETEFGVQAESFGLAERNFSFAGRDVTRRRGLVLLKPDELRQGEVSAVYLNSHMKREYSGSEEFKKVIQTIWHQVNPAQQVFAVGSIQADRTVKGGTGWAVELAKHLNKPVHVFDQDQGRWYSWKEAEWKQVDAPVIRFPKFVGTGTRSLNQSGRKAIHDLFLRTFSKEAG
jgi:hypothetical protein